MEPPPHMRATQVHLWQDSRVSLSLYCPQSGKTAAGLTWLRDCARHHPGTTSWYVTQSYDQSRSCWRRLQRICPPALVAFKGNPMAAYFQNGSMIEFKTAGSAGNLYGTPLDFGVGDEADKWPDESISAFESRFTATGGRRRYLGNRSPVAANLFIQWCDAETFATFLLTGPQAVAAGIIHPDVLDEIKESMPEVHYRQLFMLEDMAAANPFISYRNAIAARSDGAAHWAGVDVAYAPDYYAVAALDNAGQWCLDEAWRAVPYEESAVRVKALLQDQHCLVDETGVGKAHLEQLRKAGVAARGFQFTAESRQEILEALAIAISKQDITISRDTARQLAQFEVAFTPTGVRWQSRDKRLYGDDRVMALALANWSKRRPRLQVAISGDGGDYLDHPNDALNF